jgi:hypothetical protein
MRTWLLAAIAVVGPLCVDSVGIAAARIDHGMAINPSDVKTVRAYTRGQGGVVATGNCTATTCPGKLTASLLKGTPAALYGQLDVPIEVQREADPFTACHKLKGRGTLQDGAFVVQLVGDLCGGDGIRFNISASMQIFANNAACGCQDEMAAAGRFEMFGPVKTLGNDGIPNSLVSIVSFVGSAGRPTICCP